MAAPRTTTQCCAAMPTVHCSSSPSSRKHGGIKGNTGKAAQRRRFRQQMALMGGLAAILVWLLLLVQQRLVFHSTPDHHHHDKDDDDGDNTANEIAAFLQERREKHRQMRHDRHGQGRPGIVSQDLWFPGQTTIDESTPLMDDAWQDILQARVHLVDLQFHDPAYMTTVDDEENSTPYDAKQKQPKQQQQQQPQYYDNDDDFSSQMVGVFCRLDWSVHQSQPSLVPMFHDLVHNSTECRAGHKIHVPWTLLVQRVRAYDATAPTVVLPLQGAVFHESRCGSTLVANLLTALAPAQNRVYTEAGPPMAALMIACRNHSSEQQCRSEAAVRLLRDVVYLQSRSDDPGLTKVFYKFQSMGSSFIHLFAQAFPNVPWIFVYRDPTEVMVSHLKGTSYLLPSNNEQEKDATAPEPRTRHIRSHSNYRERRMRHGPPPNCLRTQTMHEVPLWVAQIVQNRVPGQDPLRLPAVQYCAAHLASLCESALAALQVPGSRGRAVNYGNLPDVLWTDILRQHFGLAVPPDGLARMQETAGQYSKGRMHALQGGTPEFHQDGASKQALATPAVGQAAQLFLGPSYRQLEALG